MRKNFTRIGLIVLASFMSIVTMAQYNVNKLHDSNQKSKTITKNLGIDASKSVTDIVFQENFLDNGIDNWTVDGEGADNWVLSPSNVAGGAVPEAYMAWSPAYDGISRFVSPVINTSAFTTLNLSFFHLIDSWVGGYTMSVETTSDGGTTWNEVWSLYWESDQNYNAMESIVIDNDDIGSENFQFCFKFEGNTDNMDAWAIDDVILGDAIAYDVTPGDLTGLEGIIYGGTEVVVATEVNNYGTEEVSFDVELEIFEGAEVVFTSTKTVSDLASGESVSVEFDAWTSIIGSYEAVVTTLLAEDENPSNDVKSLIFAIFSEDTYCFPSADCSYGDGITGFAFAGIENYDSGCSDNGYGNFTGLEANVEIGSTYTLSLETGYSSNYFSIWIDFNEDLEFTSNELILTDYLMETVGEIVELDVMIPGYGLPSNTTMRVGAAFDTPSSTDPCATFTYGEWEDYSIVVTGESIMNDAASISIDMGAVYGQSDIIPMATVKNNGVETISFPVTLNIGDDYTATTDVVDLTSGMTTQVEFDVWPATTGTYDMDLVTGLANDENPDNDVATSSVIIVSVAPDKRVVGEEGTGTWCAWCVRGIVFMEYMKETYPDTWIGIAVHNGDPMTDAEYDSDLGMTSFPGGLVARATACDPSTFEAAYQDEMEIIAPAFTNVTNRVFNPATREISFDVSCEFVGDATNYRLSGIIVENGVKGSGAGWDQANAYAGGGSGEMGGYELLPNPIPAADMIYNDVARGIIGGFDGAEGSLPSTLVAGEVYSYTFTTTLSEEWDESNMEVVGLLINQETGAIVNAAKEHMLVSVEEMVGEQYLHVYPNPANNELNILNPSNGNVYIYNMNGQLVLEELKVENTCRLDISGFENGTYIIKIVNETETFTTKVNVIK